MEAGRIGLLSVKSLSAGYMGQEVISDINLEVKKGDITALIGPNGAGKSTLLKTIVGLLRPLKGSVTLEEQMLSGLATHSIVGKGVVMVPEGRRLFASFSVMENLQMGGYLRSRQLIESLERVFELFPVLKERRKQLAGTLSGGEQQMLAIGRALMVNPKVMLLDEPSLGLAPLIVGQVYEKLVDLNRDGVTFVIVEQNVAKVLSVAESAYVMQRGQIVMHDTAEAISKRPELISTYLTSY